MSCFICLEDSGKMISQGCVCKGSITIHESCFKSWCETANDPFTCSVCKTSLSPILLANYLGLEGVMFYDPNPIDEDEEDEEEEDEEEVEWFVNHGVEYIFEEGTIYFQTVKDRDLYMESEKRQFSSKHQLIRNQMKALRMKGTNATKQLHKGTSVCGSRSRGSRGSRGSSRSSGSLGMMKR